MTLISYISQRNHDILKWSLLFPIFPPLPNLLTLKKISLCAHHLRAQEAVSALCQAQWKDLPEQAQSKTVRL